MVQIIEQNPNRSIAGRLGKGFGQGLSEQLPKEVDRYRLSQGLQNLQQNPSSDYVGQISQLYKSGATPEQVNQILPYLERANANREAQAQANTLGQEASTPVQNNARKNQQNIPQSQSMQPDQTGKPNKAPGLITKGPQQARLNPILPLTANEVKSQGADLFKRYPNLYKTQGEAEAEAVRRRNADIANQNALIQQGEAQKDIRKELETEVASRLGFDLQKGGFDQFQDVPGNYIKKKIDEEDSEIASGKKTTLEAAEDASKDIRDYSEVRLANKTEGQKWMFSKTPKDVRSMINGQREEYAKRDELKTYVDDLITNHDVSRARANYVAYPIKENKELNNWLAKQKSKSFVDQLGDMFTDNKIEPKARELANELPKYISDNDSLGAIAVELEGKGYDGGAFLDEVRDLYKKGKIRLNQRQGEELNKTGSLMPSIGDWFLFSLGDFGTLPEVI